MFCNLDHTILHSPAVDWKKLGISVVCARNKYRSFCRHFSLVRQKQQLENVYNEFDSIYLSFQESGFVTCSVSANAQMNISLLLSERVDPPAYTRHYFLPFILICLFLEVGNFSEIVE